MHTFYVNNRSCHEEYKQTQKALVNSTGGHPLLLSPDAVFLYHIILR